MDAYHPDELYAAVADELFISRKKATATGGRNNIRARGNGPEQGVRKLVGSLIGNQYRVTQGHVVRDGMKSGQIDIIIVRDVPAATLHRMHGGKSPGAPRGNSNALRHGLYSAKAISERRELAALIRSMRGLVKEVVGPE